MTERTCSVDGCERPHAAKGLCTSHRYRSARGIPFDEPIREKDVSPCAADGCGREQVSRGLCDKHYRRWLTHGDPAVVLRVQGREGCSVPECGRPHGAHGLCNLHYIRTRRELDLEAPVVVKAPRGSDFDENGYAMRTVQGKKRGVHRIVMEEILARPLQPYENVHHINGIKNDNRPANLELWVCPQPKGQRVADLVEWVAREYREMVIAVLED